MEKISGFLFNHFEKILLGMMIVYFTALWYQGVLESDLRTQCESVGGAYIGEGHCVSKEVVITM